MLPLLALPCVLGLKRFPLLGIPLAIYSVAATTLAALTDAFPDFYSHPNPLLDLQLPLLLKGRFSPTVATELGMSGYSSAALFCALLAGGVSWLLLKAPKSAADNPVCPSNDGQKMENNETPPGE
jgi:hypothetical protein